LKDSLAVGEHSVGIEDGWKLFEKIAKAVSSMHQKGVIHRDVKPPNIFIGPNEEIKLGDFGDSCWMNNYMGGRMGTPNRGTSQYMAPELSHGKVSSKVCIFVN
jgi:serine/threonine protein kinase